jgi:hypothetical protein
MESQKTINQIMGPHFWRIWVFSAMKQLIVIAILRFAKPHSVTRFNRKLGCLYPNEKTKTV